MKKLLLFAAAAIIFTSCQKEESVKDSGLTAVVMKITDEGFTKAMTADKTTEPGITWENASVTLTATSGGKTSTVTKEDLTSQSGYVIKDIVEPSKLEVSINGGAASYTELSGFNDKAAADMPIYGATETFTAQADPYTDGTKTYQKLSAAVATQIPVARIEVGGITFKTSGTKYNAITLAHIYVDGAPVDNVQVNYNSSTGYSSVSAIDHATSWTAFSTSGRGTNLSLDVSEGVNFLTDGTSTTTFPSGSQVYAFNVFGQGTDGDDLPTVKLHFTDCRLSSGTCASEQYAFIKEYKDGNSQKITKFDPGKIYQITSLEVADGNLSPDPNSETAYALVATVSIAEWDIVTTTGVLN